MTTSNHLTTTGPPECGFFVAQKEAPLQTITINPADIRVPENRRALVPETVVALADSIARIGLINPPTVTEDDQGNLTLVAGNHRLASVKALGWKTITCRIIPADDARMGDISENLHRAELSPMERDEQIAEWVRLHDERVKRHDVAKPSGGRPEGGAAAAARELPGLTARTAQRAVEAAALPAEAKKAAAEAGLSQKDRIAAAKATDPLAAVQKAANRKTSSKPAAAAKALSPGLRFGGLTKKTVDFEPKKFSRYFSHDRRLSEHFLACYRHDSDPPQASSITAKVSAIATMGNAGM